MRIFAWHSGSASHHWHLPHIYDREHGLDRHWLHRFYWWTAFLSVGFITLNVGLYLLMSYATLPFTYVNGVNVGLMSRASAIQAINTLTEQQSMSVYQEGMRAEFSYAELGISFDGTETFDNIRRVEGFSTLPLIQIITNPIVNVIPDYAVDRAQTAAVLSASITEVDEAAIPAELVIPQLEAEAIEIRASVAGKKLNAEIAANQILAAVQESPTAPNEHILRPTVVAPAVHESQLESALQQAKAVLEKPLVITDGKGKKRTEISTYQLRQLLTTNDEAELVLDDKKLDEFLKETLALYFFTAPVHTRMTGAKTMVAGSNGVQLDIAGAAETLQAEFTSSQTIALPTEVLKPAVIKDGVYPKTEMGLHALISDFDAEKSGDYRIIVQELTGDQRRATHQGAASSIPASTYKTFIAFAAMWAAERGEITLEDTTSSGTVNECMYEMLHYSTDFCAFAIQDYMGWARIDEILRINGFEDTFIGNEDRILDKYTTPQDEYKLYKGLYDGTLLNKKHTEQLLTMLKEQMWRSGIPGGSSPSIVADKVGFYAGWINDVGIVYGTKADYIIIALSDGGSFWEINDLSRRIYNFFEN